MKRVYITKFNQKRYKLKELFPLARPFLQADTDKFIIDGKNTEKSGFSDLGIEITSSLKDTDFVLVSEPLTHHHDKNRYRELAEINQACLERKIFAHVLISGDYGKVHPKLSNVIYYRMGGFKRQLETNNKAFFFLLSDQLNNLFDRNNILLRQKEDKPTVGFCGHASYSILKFFYEKFKLARVNLERALAGDFYFEPLFSSACERLKILKNLDKSKDINTNFIFRKKYRAGAITDQERYRTTLEYYNNIIESDYVICLRGSGNFSVRFFETLMMGRIPVFINTDCLLPLEDEIDWKKHVVWVEWKDRKEIAEIILEFHKNLTKESFVQLQNDNRKIWESRLSVKHYLENIVKTF